MKTFKQGLAQFVANLPLILVAIAIASLIVTGVLFAFPPKAHSAEGIVISTGSKTGNYFKVGNRLQGSPPGVRYSPVKVLWKSCNNHNNNNHTPTISV